MLLQACLNGSRRPGEHPALPLSPRELARDAQRVREAGAQELHIHVRDGDGLQTLEAAHVAAALEAIRAQCPGMPVGISTGLWIEPNVARRLARVDTWTTLPDYASVNFSEPGAEELCAALLARGIGIEAGLSTLEDARRLLAAGLAGRCLRLLIEPDEQQFAEALATAEAIEKLLTEAAVQTPRLLHGFEVTTWSLLKVARERGYALRIGLEDTLYLPEGEMARDNAELVALARSLLDESGRKL